jgi:hypothetical protein
MKFNHSQSVIPSVMRLKLSHITHLKESIWALLISHQNVIISKD